MRRNECSEGDTNRRKECMHTGATYVVFYKKKLNFNSLVKLASSSCISPAPMAIPASLPR